MKTNYRCNWFPVATTDREHTEQLKDKVREALEWLDKGAPGKCREVLIEALKR